MQSILRYQISRVKLIKLLETLQQNASGICSIYVPANLSPKKVQEKVKPLLDPDDPVEEISALMAKSSTGSVLFWGTWHRYLIMPPFPLEEDKISSVCEINPLRNLLDREFILALILVRLGSYGIGVFSGQKLLTSKVGSGLVHARHRQGGSSAHRFERHRDKQIEMFFTRICSHIRELLEPFASKIDFLVYGGTRETILEFRKQCHYLNYFDSRTLNRLLTVREPDQGGLLKGLDETWSSRVIEWKTEKYN